jgi:hypothetical protein
MGEELDAATMKIVLDDPTVISALISAGKSLNTADPAQKTLAQRVLENAVRRPAAARQCTSTTAGNAQTSYKDSYIFAKYDINDLFLNDLIDFRHHRQRSRNFLECSRIFARY